MDGNRTANAALADTSADNYTATFADRSTGEQSHIAACTSICVAGASV
jgi:hypothetical protein